MGKGLIVMVDESFGSYNVTVTTERSNMKWSMGLHFKSKPVAEEFKTVVEGFINAHEEDVTF